MGSDLNVQLVTNALAFIESTGPEYSPPDGTFLCVRECVCCGVAVRRGPHTHTNIQLYVRVGTKYIRE